MNFIFKKVGHYFASALGMSIGLNLNNFKAFVCGLFLISSQIASANDTRIQDTIKSSIENANQKLKKHSVGVCSNCSMYPTAGQEL